MSKKYISLPHVIRLVHEGLRKKIEENYVVEDIEYIDESWKYLQYGSHEEAKAARTAHFNHVLPDGSKTGNPCRHLVGHKLAYMGAFHGPKPTKVSSDKSTMKEGALDGLSGKMNVMNPGKQKPLTAQIKPINPASVFGQKPQKQGNLPKMPGNNPTFAKDLAAKVASEEVEVIKDDVSDGTKERRKLNLVGRMNNTKPDKDLARQAAYKVNVIDEERLRTIKKVLNEKDPKKYSEEEQDKKSSNPKTKVVVPSSGATPTVYNPKLNKSTPDGAISS